jgi:hypothetical protein
MESKVLGNSDLFITPVGLVREPLAAIGNSGGAHKMTLSQSRLFIGHSNWA